MLSRPVSVRLRQFPVFRYVIISFCKITAYSEYTIPRCQVIGQESPHHPHPQAATVAADPSTCWVQGLIAADRLYKIRQTGYPAHISALLIEHVTTRNLRSSETSDLEIPRTTLALASRAFSVAAPRTCNSLPTDVYVYVCICMYICDCIGLYVSVFVCIRRRKYIYISYILYICDILVLYKLSIIINPAGWLPHANKEYIIIIINIDLGISNRLNFSISLKWQMVSKALLKSTSRHFVTISLK